MGIHLTFRTFLVFCGLLMLAPAPAKASLDVFVKQGKEKISGTVMGSVGKISDQGMPIYNKVQGAATGAVSGAVGNVTGKLPVFVPSASSLTSGLGPALKGGVGGNVKNAVFNPVGEAGGEIYNSMKGSIGTGSLVNSEYLSDLAAAGGAADGAIAQAMSEVNNAKVAALTAANDAKAAVQKQATEAYEATYAQAKDKAEVLAAELSGQFPGIGSYVPGFVDDGIDEMNIKPSDFDVASLKVPTIDVQGIAMAKAKSVQDMATKKAMGYVNGVVGNVKNQAMGYAQDAVKGVGKQAVGQVKSITKGGFL